MDKCLLCDRLFPPDIPHVCVGGVLVTVHEAHQRAMKEKDPTGKSPREVGAKFDAGKLRMNLVLGDFAKALEAVVEVGTKGAEKYTPHGWRAVPGGFDRYSDAMLRHYFKEFQEESDPELGVLHAAQVAWNALARLELFLMRKP